MSIAKQRLRTGLPSLRQALGLPVLLVASWAGCGDGEIDTMMTMMMPPPVKTNPFQPLPECMGSTVEFRKGTQSMVIASIQIAAQNQGFDLDKDGKIDNKLGALSSLANSELETVFSTQHTVVIPMEFFGPTSGDSMCTKFALYLGQFNQDRDADKSDTNWESDNGVAKGDCNDQEKSVHPGATEDLTNRMDDDCDGLADNMTKRTPASDNTDADGDGVTIAQGDCDDRASSPMVPTDSGTIPLAQLRHPARMAAGIAAATERCDGIDYNCDGIPDNGPGCDPFLDNNVKLGVQRVALDAQMQPLLTFKNGTVKANKLSAGPALFKVAVPIAGAQLDLELSGARVEGTFRQAGGKSYLDNAVLGGVLEAISLARLDKIMLKGFLTPPQSLFDAVWANGALATVLGLKRDADGHALPDMDVDGDGIETFWASNPDKMPALVDTCKDGDGTIIKNGDTKYPNEDPMKRCVFAKDDKGNYRFVDGVSAALKFRAVPAQLGDLTDSL